MVVDAHIHLFENMNGFVGGKRIISQRYGKALVGDNLTQMLIPAFQDTSSTAEVYVGFMEMTGIDRAVILQNGYYGKQNAYAMAVCNKYPDKFRALGTVDLFDGKKAADELDGLLANPHFAGLKVEVDTALEKEPGARLDDVRFNPVWEVLHEKSGVLALHLGSPPDTAALKAVLERYCRIRALICHLGYPQQDEAGTGWEDVLALAKARGLSMDMSSLHYMLPGDGKYPYEQAQLLLLKAYGELGPEKILWGTDYPSVLNACTYDQSLDLLFDSKHIASRHIPMIAGENARDFYWRS